MSANREILFILRSKRNLSNSADLPAMRRELLRFLLPHIAHMSCALWIAKCGNLYPQTAHRTCSPPRLMGIYDVVQFKTDSISGRVRGSKGWCVRNSCGHSTVNCSPAHAVYGIPCGGVERSLLICDDNQTEQAHRRERKQYVCCLDHMSCQRGAGSRIELRYASCLSQCPRHATSSGIPHEALRFHQNVSDQEFHRLSTRAECG